MAYHLKASAALASPDGAVAGACPFLVRTAPTVPYHDIAAVGRLKVVYLKTFAAMHRTDGPIRVKRPVLIGLAKALPKHDITTVGRFGVMYIKTLAAMYTDNFLFITSCLRSQKQHRPGNYKYQDEQQAVTPLAA